MAKMEAQMSLRRVFCFTNGKLSNIFVHIRTRIPIEDPNPRVTNMRKKRMAKRLLIGKLANNSG